MGKDVFIEVPCLNIELKAIPMGSGEEVDEAWKAEWDELPEDVRNTLEKLGIERDVCKD